MYRKESEGWFKHIDFILIDMICLQVAFYLSYVLKGLGVNPYADLVYRNMAIVLEFADLAAMFMLDTLTHVTLRGRYRELIATAGNVVAVGLIGSAYLFFMQEGAAFSRLMFGIALVLYFVFAYASRFAWKKVLASGKWERNCRSLLIVTTKAEAQKVIKTVQANNYGKFLLSGLVIVDADIAGKSIAGVKVVANSEDAPMYVCQQWIDEVLVVVPDEDPYPEELIKKMEETGVTIHLKMSKIADAEDRRQFVEKVGSYTVLTTSLNYASAKQLLFKRVMDIAGGLVGCLLTCIIFIFIAPIIYISSPGPIFFSQERIGKNGKKFKIYKFRSMYMDAEARKAELMKQNRVADGKMFKLDFDPRVIILAGGSGTRLYPLTKVTSKQLLPIYDKPMIYYPMSVLMNAGIRDILIISTPQDTPRFENLLGDGHQFGVNLTYAVQPSPDGLAQAFIIGADFIGNDSVAMVLGDNIFAGHGLKKRLNAAVEKAENGKGATVFGYYVDDPERFGIVEFDKNGKAISIEEKPEHPKSNYCVTGLYFYDNRVVEFAKNLKPSARGELEITDLNRIYLEDGTLNVELLGQGFTWLDTGTHESLVDATNFVKTVEQHQHRKIACLEEIAYLNGWISKDELMEVYEVMKKNQYGQYLKDVMDGKYQEHLY